MANSADKDMTLDLAPRATWGAMMSRAFHTLINNPGLLVPPMFVGLAHLSLYAVFGYVFLTSLAAKMAELRYTAWDMNAVRLAAALMRVSWPYLLCVLGIVLLGRLLIGTFHNAGWSAMFARAARTGNTGLADYGYGVFMFSPRFLGAVFVKLAIHLIPVLFVLIMLALLRGAGNVLWGDVIKVALPFAPVLIGLELLIGLALSFWRQSLALEDAGAVESLARSYAFVRARMGDVFALIGLWMAYNMAVSMVFSAVGATLMQAVPQDADPRAVGLRLVLYLNTAFLSWLFQFAGMVYFVLLGFVLYYERAVAPLEEQPPEQDGAPEPEQADESVPLSEAVGLAPAPETLQEQPDDTEAAGPPDGGQSTQQDQDTPGADTDSSRDVQSPEAKAPEDAPGTSS
jgi:hypothetical protein